MSYVEKWAQMKAEFEENNKDIADELQAAKAQLKKQKDKAKPNQDKIDDLEDMIANRVTIKKKKTGLTQLLPVYDKVLDKMDALMAAKHDPTDAKVWKPLYQALAKLRPAMTKANAAAQKNFGDWEDYAVKSWTNYAKMGGPEVQKIEKRLKPKNTAARDLLNELSKMQREMAQRMAAISTYLGPNKDNW